MADDFSVGIVGLGASVPAQVRRNTAWPADWASRAWSKRDTPDLMDRAERLIASQPESVVHQEAMRFAADPFRGSVERRVAERGLVSSDLEATAARGALEVANIGPDGVDVLLTHSELTDDPGLGNHGILARELGLRRQLLSFTLEAGCGSFGPQVVTAQALLAGGLRRALLVQGALSSRVVDYRSPTSTNVGDGAAAQVLGPVEPGFGILGWEQLTRGDLRDGVLLGRDGGGRWYEAPRVPAPFMVYVRDASIAARLGGEGPELCRQTCVPLLDRLGVDIGDIALLVTPQPTAWFARACARMLGMDPERTVPISTQFQRFGHLSSASAPLGLWLAWQEGRVAKGDLVLVYTPGAGFTLTAVLHRWALEPPSPTQQRATPPAPERGTERAE